MIKIILGTTTYPGSMAKRRVLKRYLKSGVGVSPRKNKKAIFRRKGMNDWSRYFWKNGALVSSLRRTHTEVRIPMRLVDLDSTTRVPRGGGSRGFGLGEVIRRKTGDCIAQSMLSILLWVRSGVSKGGKGTVGKLSWWGLKEKCLENPKKLFPRPKWILKLRFGSALAADAGESSIGLWKIVTDSFGIVRSHTIPFRKGNSMKF